MATVLLVDDDRDFTAALARMLTQEGYSTRLVTNAAAALQEVERHPGAIDLVLLDLSLARESGLDLLVTLHQQLPHLPVILLSASPDAGSYLEALRLGAYEFLAKPLNFAELREVAWRALHPVGRTP